MVPGAVTRERMMSSVSEDNIRGEPVQMVKTKSMSHGQWLVEIRKEKAG